jgi:hypothetical protein
MALRLRHPQAVPQHAAARVHAARRRSARGCAALEQVQEQQAHASGAPAFARRAALTSADSGRAAVLALACYRDAQAVHLASAGADLDCQRRA